MIHETHREILLLCDTVTCPEGEALPPNTELCDWLRKSPWATDGDRHFCAACCAVTEKAA